MECRECRQEMHRYLAEALPARWVEQFEGHISACPECRGELQHSQQVLAMLRKLPAPIPPPALAERIKSAARANLHQPQAVTARPAYAYLAAAVGAVALVGMALFTAVHAPWHAPEVRSAIVSAVKPAPLPGREETRYAAANATRLVGVSAPMARRYPAVHRAGPAPTASALTGSSRDAASGPQLRLTTELAKPPSARLTWAVGERTARVPLTLVAAAARTGPSPSPAVTALAGEEERRDDVAAQTLVGTVVASALIGNYVRNSIIESDATVLALTTSSPAPATEVVPDD